MRPENLHRDGSYFLVTYHDKALQLPAIATYVYVGKNIFGTERSADDARWFFQTAESRVADGIFDPKVHEPGERLLAVGEDMIEEFCDLGQLIEALREIEARTGSRR